MNLTDPSGLQPPDTLGKHNISQVATLQDARNSPGKFTRITVGGAEWPIPESGELLILLVENNEPGMSTVATNLEAKYEKAKLIDFDFQGTLIQRLKELKSDSFESIMIVSHAGGFLGVTPCDPACKKRLPDGRLVAGDERMGVIT